VSDSIREKIMKDVKESLEEIRISNGYEVDIDNVTRFEQDGNPKRNTPCIEIVPDGETKNPENTFPETRCVLSLALLLYFRHDKNVFDCSTDEALNKFLADIEKALMATRNGIGGHLRGGNAITTTVNGNEAYEVTEGQPFIVLVVNVDILYAHDHDDPYS